MITIIGIYLRTAVLFLCAFVIGLAASGYISAQSSAPDPLAELEAWNKIKESTLATDYDAFLKKFPNGSLATRAREKMNTLGDPVWNELKKSNDPFRYRDYIKNNPNSPFLDQAKVRMDRLIPAAVAWEKAKAAGDLDSIMQFISSDPAGPFAAEAKASIQPKLLEAIAANKPVNLLEFYANHYSDTPKGKEVAATLESVKEADARSTFAGIKARIEALNGKKIQLRPTQPGAVATDVWFENKVVDPCKVELNWSSFLLRNSTRYSYGLVGDVRQLSFRTHFDADTNTTAVFAKPITGAKMKIPFLAFGPDGNLIVLPVTHLDMAEMAVLTTNDHSAAQALFDDLNKLVDVCKAPQ